MTTYLSPLFLGYLTLGTLTSLLSPSNHFPLFVSALYCDAVNDCHLPTDNTTLVSDEISSCIRHCCGTSSDTYGTVYFPSSVGYRISSVDLTNVTNCLLDFGDDSGWYATSDRDSFPITPFYPPMGNSTCYRAVVFGQYVHNITFKGSSNVRIDGNGSTWWNISSTSATTTSTNSARSTTVFPTATNIYPPKLVELVDSSDLYFIGIHYSNSPMWHHHPIYSQNIHFTNVTVTTDNRIPGGTDGIDPECCQNVVIDQCTIDVGDDGMSIKSGYHPNGTLIASQNILVTRSMIYSRNFAIGSACFGNITNITVTDTTIGDDYGSSPWAIKIKSHIPLGGIVNNILFTNLSFGNITSNAYQQPNGGMAISIYQNYGTPGLKYNTDTDRLEPIPTSSSSFSSVDDYSVWLDGWKLHQQLYPEGLPFSVFRYSPYTFNDYIAAYHFYTFYSGTRSFASSPSSTVPTVIGKTEPLPTLITNVTFQAIRGRSCLWAANPISGSNISKITRLTFDNVDLGHVTNSKDPWLCTLVNDTQIIGEVYPPLPSSCGV